jgi:hypothetical protein
MVFAPPEITLDYIKGEAVMADKQIKFTDQDQMELEAIVIDRDKEEALRFLAKLVAEFKGSLGQACGTGPIK